MTRGRVGLIVGGFRALLVVVLLLAGHDVCAQEKQITPSFGTSPLPPPEILAGLLRWTMVAVAHANATANYSVLYDLGSATFKANNSTAKLSQTFAGFRAHGFDMSFVTLLTPELTEAPTIDQQGVLKMKGRYPTRPTQLNFELLFDQANGSWRHRDIALGAGPPAEPPKPAEQPAPPPPAKKAPAKKKE